MLLLFRFKGELSTDHNKNEIAKPQTQNYSC